MTVADNPAAVVATLLERLEQKHPGAKYELDWKTPAELLVATILAAQATDKRVNDTTPALFARYPSPKAFAEADPAELEGMIKSCGFFKQKAKTIIAACRVLVDKFGGEVPKTVDELTQLPGFGRKSANVVLNTAFDIASGIIVDTHVQRVAQRMGLSKHDDPEEIEKDLMRIVPQHRWTFFGPAMVLHGRYTCKAKKPECDACTMSDICDKKLD